MADEIITPEKENRIHINDIETVGNIVDYSAYQALVFDVDDNRTKKVSLEGIEENLNYINASEERIDATEGRISAVEDSINKINGDADVAGSISNKISESESRIMEKVDALNDDSSEQKVYKPKVDKEEGKSLISSILIEKIDDLPLKKGEGEGSVSGGGDDSIANGNYSFAFGTGAQTSVNAIRSMAFGNGAIAENSHSLSFGDSTEAKGKYSLAFGESSFSEGEYSISVGSDNKALGNYSIALGTGAKAISENSLSTGKSTVAGGYLNGSTVSDTPSADGTDSVIGECAVSIGNETKAYGSNSLSIGSKNEAYGNNSFSGGKNNFSLGDNSFSFGENLVSRNDGEISFGIGNKSAQKTTNENIPYTIFSIGNGEKKKPNGEDGIRKNLVEIQSDGSLYILGLKGNGGEEYNGENADPATNSMQKIFSLKTPVGEKTSSNGEIFNTYTGDSKNEASKNASHAEGINNIVNGIASHGECIGNSIQGDYAHAEGNGNIVSGQSGHAEGDNNNVTKQSGHAEGSGNTASGDSAHAEGSGNTAGGNYSHAGGKNSKSHGDASLTGGFDCETRENSSIAVGYSVKSYSIGQASFGRYNSNIVNNVPVNDYSSGGTLLENTSFQSTDNGIAFSIGNGTSSNNRSDLLRIMYNGDTYINGIGEFNGTNFSTAKTLKQVLDGMDTSSFLNKTGGPMNGDITFTKSEESSNGIVFSPNNSETGNIGSIRHSGDSLDIVSTKKISISSNGFPAVLSGMEGSKSFSVGEDNFFKIDNSELNYKGNSLTSDGSLSLKNIIASEDITANGRISIKSKNRLFSVKFVNDDGSHSILSLIYVKEEAAGPFNSYPSYKHKFIDITGTDGYSKNYTYYSKNAQLSANNNLVYKEIDGSVKEKAMNSADSITNDKELFSVEPYGYMNVLSATATNGFYNVSDENLKDFHEDVEVDFEKIKNIPKKKFTWKDQSYGKRMQIGTSAQEVEKIYPELVRKTADGILSVDYEKLSIVALKAIDLLNDKISKLEARINDLENGK